VTLLAPYLPGIATQTTEDAPRALYRAIASTISPHLTLQAFDEYLRHPEQNDDVKRILRSTVRNDPTFAAQLAQAVAGVARSQ
jgi:hypothetical protein